jgi:hypothetical protein
MKLIMEDPLLLDGSIEETLNESTGTTERNYYISGTFSTPEAKNRNGRVYSRSIWEREVAKYQKEINEKTVNTLGEWQHPPRSTVDPIKAVLRIVELKMDANGNVVGKAKILNNNTEATNSIKGLIKEGIKIGVSSRGVGKVSSTGVVEDFKLITYDAVDMPSDYNAMLNGVVEGVQVLNGIVQDKEYQIDENGCIGEACSLTNPLEESTNKGEDKLKEKCPIQEKIDEAVAASEKKIYDNIDAYLQESFAKLESERVELIESISDFLSPSETIIDESKEVEVAKPTENFADKLLKALKEKEEESKDGNKKDADEDDSTVGKCTECGKEVEEDEKICKACADKVEDKEEKVDESDLLSKLKNKVFN